MKKFIALAAVAAVFAGCDFAGGGGTPVTISNVSVSQLSIPEGMTATVDVQDIGGRSFYRADYVADAPLGGFEASRPEHTLFVTVFVQAPGDGLATVIASSTAFNPGDLTGDTTLEMSDRAGTVVGQTTIDMP